VFWQCLVREDGGGCRVWLERAKDSYPSPYNNKFNVIFQPKPAIPPIEILAQVSLPTPQHQASTAPVRLNTRFG
jgi:hypothetical protein